MNQFGSEASLRKDPTNWLSPADGGKDRKEVPASRGFRMGEPVSWNDKEWVVNDPLVDINNLENRGRVGIVRLRGEGDGPDDLEEIYVDPKELRKENP